MRIKDRCILLPCEKNEGGLIKKAAGITPAEAENSNMSAILKWYTFLSSTVFVTFTCLNTIIHNTPTYFNQFFSKNAEIFSS